MSFLHLRPWVVGPSRHCSIPSTGRIRPGSRRSPFIVPPSLAQDNIDGSIREKLRSSGFTHHRVYKRIECHDIASAPGRADGEFLGTALLILLGDGVVAGDVLLNKTSDKMMITTAWGLAVALAVYSAGG